MLQLSDLIDKHDKQFNICLNEFFIDDNKEINVIKLMLMFH